MSSNYFFVLFFAASVYFLYELYEPFWQSILIASLLVVSTANINQIIHRLTHSDFWAALISTLLLAFIFFSPLGYFLTELTIKLNNLDINNIQTIQGKIDEWIAHAPKYLHFVSSRIHEYLSSLTTADITNKVFFYARTLGQYSANYLTTVFMIIIFYFFAHYYGRSLLAFFKSVVHIPSEDVKVISFELSSVMGIVFYSIIITAVLEGVLFGIAVYFLGYDGLLFGILYGIASLLPIVGGAVVWVPFAIYELVSDDIADALFISVYSVVIIAIIADTFLKPLIIRFIKKRVIRSEVDMNELLIFFAIFAGLATYGFWGMIIGPAITAFFMSLLKILGKYAKESAVNAKLT